MALPRSRGLLLCLCCLVVSATIAGCLGGAGVGDAEARERALAAEGDHIAEQLENATCVEGWGPTSYAGVEREATVTNRTADGVYVEVTHPYWYSTGRDEADVGSNARYLVTADAVRRVGGTDVSPC
ncbi:hypothetical protein HUG10_18940 (plasmid) [Halorarum halophilum]|uniref:Uncharacterized protein n=1 Tax=Halorarum halophilum TaxID=2743090 RepID=A0A7D5GED3_9EURY|nr:hypothetical protein [Halobaculum halophilum]QLG29685.1 hypothetical protein HUG10_18940 [Halobaculum halophilum]